MIKLKFNKNFKKELYIGLQRSNRMRHTYRIINRTLIIDQEDIEEVSKIFDRILLKYRVSTN